jgi:Family of unknown function (DUF6516)
VRARLLLSDKTVFEDGSILQIRVWSVPQPVPPARHGYKYSLFYGRPGERLVGFDNERGKGDHKHVRGIESAYLFVSLEQLLDDFEKEVDAVKGTAI